MTVEYEPNTDYYGEVYDLLQIAKQVVHPWGGKKLSDDLCTHFIKHIVDGDKELSDLAAAGNSFTQECHAIKESPGDSVAELERKDIDLLLLKLRVDVNLMHMKRLVRDAERLKGMLVANYI